MRSFIIILVFIGYSISGKAQIPSPMSNSASTLNSAVWTKTNALDFTLHDRNGNSISKVKDLVYLKTDTLAVLDTNARTIYLLEDFKDASPGTVGKASILATNIGKDFFLTNPYSFITYVNDESYSGDFSNITGNYIDFIAEVNATYFLEGIRSFTNWGARNMSKLPAAPDDTYWYRDADKEQYGVIKKGKTIDYSTATTEKDGNDLIVLLNGTKTYILPGYSTMASFVFNPVKLFSTNTSTTPSNDEIGCVQGDCVNGWGKWQYEDAYYDGFWKDSKRDGYGLYKWVGIGKYIGNWEEDTMSGYGAYLADNDDNIIGEYSDGQLNGVGYSVTGDDWQQGIYIKGNLTTSYTFYTNDIEVGCTAGDCQNKYGKMVWSNGDTYVGFFKNGALYMGTYTFTNGDKYSGMFNSKNQFEGTGRYFYESGGYYGGEWKNGQYHGRGYYHNKDIEQQIGVWSQGILVTKMK
jgi:hypothetical protein